MPPQYSHRRLTQKERNLLENPTIIAAMVPIGYHLVSVLLEFFRQGQDTLFELITILAFIFYLVIFQLVIVPRLNRYEELSWLVTGIHTIFISLFYAQAADHYNTFPDGLMILMVCASAAVGGRGQTYFFIGVTSLLRLFFYRHLVMSGEIDFFTSIGLVVVALVVAITILSMRQIIQRHQQRLETLSNVARNLASSLETHQVVSLLSAVVQNSFLADTYYVGSLKDDKLCFELFYDDGEFFPANDIPLEGTLAGWVVQNKKSLILFDLEKDAKKHGIQWITMGKPKVSRSWMGTPIELGGKILGIVAVASYKKNVFDQADLELLESVAQQAALAIDNSYHHAEVEHQSHLDSLTGVYNHGYFLKCLAQEAEKALQNNYSISLIMLDIDYFKQYNDNYGHLVGDKVLSMLVANIRSHIKSSDLVGRWGGEEFAILLLQTNGAQASMVAERIRQSMNSFIMNERENRPIPSPTVSQGLALYPAETTEIFKLVDLADQRLYVAKDRGRNQIEPPLGTWGYPPEYETTPEANQSDKDMAPKP